MLLNKPEIKDNFNISRKFSLIIPAAGEGTRLKTSVPKILYKLNNKPMICWIMDLFSDFSDDIIIILSDKNFRTVSKFCKKTFPNLPISFKIQKELTGMSDAVSLGVSAAINDQIFIIWGDQPCFKRKTIMYMMNQFESDKNSGLIMPIRNVTAPYIHLERDEDNNLINVLEKREKDLLPKVGLSDAGLFLFRKKTLKLLLSHKLFTYGKETNEKSFLKLFPMIEKTSYLIEGIYLDDDRECLGVNTSIEAIEAEIYLRNENN